MKCFSFEKFIEEPDLAEGRPFQSIPASRRYLKSQVRKDGQRIDAAFEKLFYRAGPKQLRHSYDVVFCHANVIRYFVCRALQIPKEAWLRMSLPHCSITILQIAPNGNVSLRCLGDSGFLETEMVTTKNV